MQKLYIGDDGIKSLTDSGGDSIMIYIDPCEGSDSYNYLITEDTYYEQEI